LAPWRSEINAEGIRCPQECYSSRNTLLRTVRYSKNPIVCCIAALLQPADPTALQDGASPFAHPSLTPRSPLVHPSFTPLRSSSSLLLRCQDGFLPCSATALVHSGQLVPKEPKTNRVAPRALLPHSYRTLIFCEQIEACCVYPLDSVCWKCRPSILRPCLGSFVPSQGDFLPCPPPPTPKSWSFSYFFLTSSLHSVD